MTILDVQKDPSKYLSFMLCDKLGQRVSFGKLVRFVLAWCCFCVTSLVGMIYIG